ncbi:MAG: HAD-IA family hydrolase [Acidimicrobiales bacterium]|nr:HAD-IA family hydrolase [Acidimicrobiales bacterium]
MPTPPSTDIDAVLFDFGGVILTSPFEAFARYEADNGLPPDTIRTINATNPDENAWAKLERSDVDLAGFSALFESEAAALGYTVDAAAVLECLAGDVRPQMVEALHRLRAHGYPLAMLTNNVLPDPAESNAMGAANNNARTDMQGIIELFDVVVESSKAGCRKPEVRFYELACEQLAVGPDRCVFLDDLGINLKPARAMGMTTIKVGDPDVALAELADALGHAL